MDRKEQIEFVKSAKTRAEERFKTWASRRDVKAELAKRAYLLERHEPETACG